MRHIGCVDRTTRTVRHFLRCVSRTALVLFTMLLPPAASAGDWPQILGPHRNGVADDEHLNFDWPGGKPKTLWQRDVGEGVAGVAVANGQVVLFHRVGNEEVAEAMDALTGKVAWRVGFPTKFQADVATAGNGPRCVPLIDGDRVYLFGAAGDLHCLAITDGTEKWSVAAYTAFQAPPGYFGAGSTPIVEGDKLLVNVGGRSGAGIVAFDRDSGRTIWKATDDQASYSAPTAVTIDGVRHVIFVTRLHVVSIDPDNGSERFRFPFGQRGPTVNGATPLVVDGHVFVSASYGIGAVFAKIGKTETKTVWAKGDVMSSQYSTCVLKDGYLYGSDGRQDIGVASLRCFNPMTGKVAWTKERFGVATLILADGALIIVKTDGTLVIAEPDPKQFHAVATAQILDTSDREPALALPALANGFLYVRDTRSLKCIDLRK